MNPTTKHLVIIAVVCWLTFFLNLGQARLWDRDEPRNAGCAAEMLAVGNWTVPIFNDELRQQKPVLLYWLMMMAYQIFGVNEFGARFWSALLGTGSAFLTYSIGRRLFDATVGLLSGVALASSLMFCVAARAATPDSVLIFCCTLAYWFYLRGVFEKGGRPDDAFPTRAINWIGFYISLGLAVLAKGPIGFLIPMAVAGMFMLMERTDSNDRPASWGKTLNTWIGYFAPPHFWRTLLAMRIFTGVGIALLVAVPWYLIVHLQTDGDFTRRFFLSENFGRATRAMESHGGGLWFYPLAILVGFFPWSVFTVPTISWLWSDRTNEPSQRSAVRFLLCWVAIQVIAFSLFSTKLPSYVTPCYPALAILTAATLASFVRSINLKQPDGWKRWLLKAASITLTISGVAIAIGLFVAMNKLFADLRWLALLGIVPILGGALSHRLLVGENTRRYPWVIAITAALFCSGLFGFGAVSVDQKNPIGQLTDTIAASEAKAVASWRCLEPSWVFYGGKPIHELVPSSTESATKEPSFQRTGFWKHKPPMTPAQFAARFPNGFVLTTSEHLAELETLLPATYVVTQEVNYFLKDDRQLLLLGAAPTGRNTVD